MAFLTTTDYKDQIQDDILAQVIEEQNDYLAAAERKAQAEMTGYLNVRYEVAAIFAQSGEGRNAEIVMYMVDLVLYHLHSRISPGQVPELRRERYNEAKRWLEWVSQGKLEPMLPKPTGSDSGAKEHVKYGSVNRRDPYF